MHGLEVAEGARKRFYLIDMYTSTCLEGTEKEEEVYLLSKRDDS